MESPPFRIDVHHHVFPPAYVATLHRLGVTVEGGVPIPRWGVDSTLAFKNRALVDPTHVLFGTDLGVAMEFLAAETARGIAEEPRIDGGARRLIERDSALALFARLRATEGQGGASRGST